MLPGVDTEGDDAAADEAFLERTRLEGGVPSLDGAEAEALLRKASYVGRKGVRREKLCQRSGLDCGGAGTGGTR